MKLCSRKAWAGALAAVIGGALALGAAAAPASAEPAMWEAKSANGGVAYLFGTFHLLKPDIVWDTPKFEEAFGKSQELWIEVKDLDDKQGFASLVVRYGVDAAHPLSTKLSPGDKALLAKDAATLGKSPAYFEPMRPWFTALLLSLAPIELKGYSPASGVDVLVKAKADARKEPVEAFETLEEQIRFFADLPAPLEMSYLHQTLKEFDLDLAEFDEAAADWANGDVDSIDKVLLGEMRRDAPELYDILLKRRNEKMADRIAARLEKGGVIFVAVGAGHLAGPDGIQAALERRGVKVKRL